MLKSFLLLLIVTVSLLQLSTPKIIKKIFIDPGHGGESPGAIGNDIIEAKKNLEISLFVGPLLEAKNYEIKYSRTTDATVSLLDRARMANEWEADFFLCIHANAFTNPNAKGTETFLHPNGGKISRNYAEKINAALVEKMMLVDRKVQTADFVVLRESQMPAVLVETAFVSNVEDAEKLKQFPKEFAEAIASAFEPVIS